MNSKKIKVVVISSKHGSLLPILAEVTSCWGKKMWSLWKPKTILHHMKHYIEQGMNKYQDCQLEQVHSKTVSNAYIFHSTFLSLKQSYQGNALKQCHCLVRGDWQEVRKISTMVSTVFCVSSNMNNDQLSHQEVTGTLCCFLISFPYFYRKKNRMWTDTANK